MRWYQKDPLFWPPTERGGEFTTANLQTQSYLGREHNARWAALGVAHAASDLTTDVLTLLLPRSILGRDQLNPYVQGAQGKEVEQWQSGVTMSAFTKEQYREAMEMLDLDATPQEGMIFHCAGQASRGWQAFDIGDLQACSTVRQLA